MSDGFIIIKYFLKSPFKTAQKELATTRIQIDFSRFAWNREKPYNGKLDRSSRPEIADEMGASLVDSAGTT